MQELVNSAHQAGQTTAQETAIAPEAKAKPWFKGLKFWLVLVLLMATVLEGLVFNHFYFRFALGDYQTVTVPLPFNEQLGENAYVLNPKQKSLTINGLDLELMTVGFKLKGEHTLLKGSIALLDDSSIVIPLVVNHFKVAPSDITLSNGNLANVPANPYKFLVNSKGTAQAVIISFDNIKSGVILSDLTLNTPPAYHFSVLRWLALSLFGAVIVLVWQKRLYQLRLGDLSPRQFRLVQGVSLAVCLGISLSFSYLTLPTHISPTTLFDFVEHGFIKLGNSEQSLLLDFPRTQQELEYHDPYVQNLDALLKGQLNIDVIIDTDVLNAANDPRINDHGWRAINGIESFWDRSLYDGKIYAYYGYGPIVLFYLPLYLITGQAPSPSLCIIFFSTVAVLGMFLGVSAVTRFYGVLPRANALLYTLCQSAAILGTHIVCVQCHVWFYAYADLLCAGQIGLLTYLIYSVPGMTSCLKKRLTLITVGLLIVLIVQTRPHLLLPSLLITCPIFWALIRARLWQHESRNSAQHPEMLAIHSIPYTLKDKLFDALSVGVPLAVGAVITMTLNYLRFDSVFSFGQSLCLNGENQIFKTIDFSLEVLSAMSHMFLTSSWIDLADFPYYGLPTEAAHSLGIYIATQNYLGMFASPVWWGIGLVILLFCLKSKSQIVEPKSPLICSNGYNFNQELLLKTTIITLLLLALIMCYAMFMVVVTSIRLLTECLMPLVPFVVVLWVKFIGYEANSSLQAKLCYWVAILLLMQSIVMDSLGPFSVLENFMPYLVPDDWLKAQSFLSPISTVY